MAKRKEETKSVRVNMTIPKADYDVIEKNLIKKGRFLSVPEYIRFLIKKDLKARRYVDV